MCMLSSDKGREYTQGYNGRGLSDKDALSDTQFRDKNIYYPEISEQRLSSTHRESPFRLKFDYQSA